MTTIAIRATASCAGGEHVTVQASLDGGPPRQVVYGVAEMMEPLTEVDIATTVLPLIRLHARGLTRAQLRNDLLAGLSIVV